MAKREQVPSIHLRAVNTLEVGSDLEADLATFQSRCSMGIEV